MAGKVVVVLPVDLARDEIVLIRQFRLPAHLANGRGDYDRNVAGRVEPSETLMSGTARMREEIGVAPSKLVELFSYPDDAGITDEEVTVFLAAIDASRVPRRAVSVRPRASSIETIRVSIDAALAALARGARCATVRWSSRCNGWRSIAVALPNCWVARARSASRW